MSPRNLPCVAAARPDVCALANNHVLDFGQAGLAEALAALASAGLTAAGAGPDAAAAWQPAAVPLPGGGRLLVFSCGTASSGIPTAWAATAARPGSASCPACPAWSPIPSSPAPRLPAGWRPRRRVHPLGSQLGIRRAPGPGPVRAPADRRRHQPHPRPLLPSPLPSRGLPRQAHPLRLRRLHRRLGGHQRLRGVPGRVAPAVLRVPVARYRRAAGAADGAHAGAENAATARQRRRQQVAGCDAEPDQPQIRNADRASARRHAPPAPPSTEPPPSPRRLNARTGGSSSGRGSLRRYRAPWPRIARVWPGVGPRR